MKDQWDEWDEMKDEEKFNSIYTSIQRKKEREFE